jgi:hypothetical protein
VLLTDQLGQLAGEVRTDLRTEAVDLQVADLTVSQDLARHVFLDDCVARYRQLERLASAQQAQLDHGSLWSTDQADRIVDVLAVETVAVDGDHQVAGEQAGTQRRRFADDLGHRQAARI